MQCVPLDNERNIVKGSFIDDVRAITKNLTRPLEHFIIMQSTYPDLRCFKFSSLENWWKYEKLAENIRKNSEPSKKNGLKTYINAEAECDFPEGKSILSMMIELAKKEEKGEERN